jgi:hypothetical protein
MTLSIESACFQAGQRRIAYDFGDGMRVDGQDGPGSGSGVTVTVAGQAGAGRPATGAALRIRVPRGAGQGLLALAIYLTVYLTVTVGPLLSHLAVPVVAQTYPDPNFYVWSWQWWPYALIHGLNPLYSAQIGAPAGYDLAWTTPTAAVAVLLSPVTELFGPIVSFNLALVLAAPASAWAAFLAARQLTGRFWAALAAGAVFGFSWYEVGQTQVGHPNLCVTAMLPLMVYLALLWRDGKLGSRSFVALLAVAMAAEFYIFDEAFFWMTVLWAALILIGLVLARPADRPQVVRLAKLATMAWAAALVAALPYLAYALRHAPETFARAQVPHALLDLRTLVTPWSGIVLLVIALALAVFAWKLRLTRLLVTGLVLVLALAVGPELVIGDQVRGTVPWAALWQLPFAVSSEPVRFLIFAYLLLALIVAAWLGLPARNKLLLAARWTVGLIAVAGIMVNASNISRGYVTMAGHAAGTSRPSYALPAFFTSGAYRHYLHPGETVVVVSDRGNAGMLFQACTNFYVRLSGGFINATFTAPNALPAPVAALQHPTPAREKQFLAYTRQANIRAVIVEDAWAAPWMNIFPRIGLHPTHVGGVTLYRPEAAAARTVPGTGSTVPRSRRER